MFKVSMYTDGSCRRNPGPGGWSAILMYGDRRKEISGRAHRTTNNAMELKAVIEGISVLKRPCAVTVYTDSQYVERSFKGLYKTKTNVRMWNELNRVIAEGHHTVSIVKVPGHAGNVENERCDQMARAESLQALVEENIALNASIAG